MNLVLDAAKTFQEVADEHGWPIVFIGGIAASYWGEPRMTRDFDVCFFTDFGGEEKAIDSILSRYKPRSENPVPFALQYRLLRIVAEHNIPADIALGALPFERDMIDRSKMRELDRETRLRLPTPEDLIVMKAFAGRERDWEDIRGVVKRRGSELDIVYIRRQILPLLEIVDKPDHMEKLTKILPGLAG